MRPGWDALTDSMLSFYRESYEKAIRLLDILTSQVEQLKEELYALRRSYSRVEDYATEQEYRADALHNVIEGFIARQDHAVRRDLLESIRETGREFNMELDFSDYDSGSDISIEVLSE